MISFVNKIIIVPKHTPGKRISAKVVWKKDKFQVRVGKDLYDIDGWNDLSEVSYIYALPTNTYYTPWHRKLYSYQSKTNSSTLTMTLRFWGRWRHGMIIYGKIDNNIFYPSKIRNDESSISEIVAGTV